MAVPKPNRQKMKNISSEILADCSTLCVRRLDSPHNRTIESRPGTPRLNPEHRDHLKAEGFSDQDIDWMHETLGICSLTEQEAKSLNLGCKDLNGKFSSSSGIYFPFSSNFGQLRCDNPPIRGIKADGKPAMARYLTRCGTATEAWLPDGCEVVTEGPKDACAGTLLGYILTGALPGVSHYRKAANLKRGSKLTVLFDADGWRNPQVFTQLIKAGVYLKGKIQLIPEIPGEPKAGLCEYFKAGHTPEDYRKLIESAFTPAKFLGDLPKHWSGLSREDLEACEGAVLKLCAIYLTKADLIPALKALGVDPKDEEVVAKLESFAAAHLSLVKAEIMKGEFTPDDLSEINGFYFWQVCLGDPIYADFLRFFKMGDRLRFNTLKKRVEFDGKEVDVGTARTWLNINYDFKAKTKIEFAEILVQAAKLNSYSPVVEYLDAVFAKHGSGTSILEGMSERYFGQSDPIYNAMLKRTLIAAAARAYEHSCKADTALILQGKQGVRKSTFFKVLAGGDEYFTDSFGNSSDKDERLKIHEVWFCEWAELETVFRRKDVAATKAFLSSSVDLVRPPYGRTTQKMERCSIFVGTTNQGEFLSDSTGNRRFWIIPVVKDIDIRLLKAERDRIWAAAVELYKNGEQWWLTDLEEAAADEIAENFKTSDPWTPIITAYLSGKDSVTTSQIMQNALQLDISKRDRGLEMRVGEILKSSGYERKQKRIDGRRVYVYELLSSSSSPVTILNSEVVTAKNQSEQALQVSVISVTTLTGKTQEKKTSELENITQVLPRSGSDGGDSNQKSGGVSVLPVTPLLDKLVTGSDGVMTGKNTFKEGDIVRYIGAKHSTYRNEAMPIAQVKDGMFNCHTKAGGFTTWFYPSDLVLES